MGSHTDTPSLVFYPEQEKLSRKLYSRVAIFDGKNKFISSEAGEALFLKRRKISI